MQKVGRSKLGHTNNKANTHHKAVTLTISTIYALTEKNDIVLGQLSIYSTSQFSSGDSPNSNDFGRGEHLLHCSVDVGSADHCTTATGALLLLLLLAAGRGGGGGVVASCQLCGSAADVESTTSVTRHCCHLPGERG